jgi:superfamily II DNA or RNA helicase
MSRTVAETRAQYVTVPGITIADRHTKARVKSRTAERDAFQADAVAAVLECFKAGADRCQGYAPTGSGKTHIATAIWDGLDPAGGIMVMVSPTRSVTQAAGKFRDYCRATIPLTRYLKVTGDHGGTTDPAQIEAFLSDDSSPRMVFVTDSSLPRVTEALVKLGLVADLFIVDEAHRNTAVRRADVEAYWAEEAVTKLPAARRFYLTATPRSTFDEADPDGRGLRIISQGNAELFGPVAFDLPFDEAVARGIVLPVAAYNFETTDGELVETLGRAGITQMWHGKRMDYREIAAHLAVYKAVTNGLPAPEGTDDGPYRPERIMVTFNRVSQARAFVRHHAAVMRALGIPAVKAFVYVGRTSEGDRQVARRVVRELDHGGHGLSHAVIAQCGALTEGFDLPDLDMTLVADYGKSTVTIQQLIGRVTRLPVRSSKSWASVVTTDVNPGELADEPPFYSVVRALTGQSESLRHELFEDRNTKGLGGVRPVQLGSLDGQPLPGDFAERFRLALVPRWHRDGWIPEFTGQFKKYVTEHGHADPPVNYVTPDGYRLGLQAKRVREDYAEGWEIGTFQHREAIRALRVELDALGFRWDRLRRRATDGEYRDELIQHLKRYAADHDGSLSPPVAYVAPDGYRLGQKISRIRHTYRLAAKGESISPVMTETIKALDMLGFGWEDPRGVLTEALVLEIRRHSAAGKTGARIAGDLGLSPSTVESVISGRAWRHVGEAAPAGRPCADCGTIFDPPRRDARYCSKPCLQRAYRRRRDAESA